MKRNSGYWLRINITFWGFVPLLRAASYCLIARKSGDGMTGKVVQIKQ